MESDKVLGKGALLGLFECTSPLSCGSLGL